MPMQTVTMSTFGMLIHIASRQLLQMGRITASCTLAALLPISRRSTSRMIAANSSRSPQTNPWEIVWRPPIITSLRLSAAVARLHKNLMDLNCGQISGAIYVLL